MILNTFRSGIVASKGALPLQYVSLIRFLCILAQKKRKFYAQTKIWLYLFQVKNVETKIS